MNPPTIKTERLRLRLRPFRDEDLPAYLGLFDDADSRRFIARGASEVTPEEGWRHLAMLLGHWRLRGYGMWAVTERGDGRLLGRVGLHRPHGWPGLEVGWALTADARGRGYATESAQAAVDWGFERLEVDKLISLIDPENAASIGVAERIGERFSRTIEHRCKTTSVYAIDRETWRLRRG